MRRDLFAGLQVRDGAGHFQDPVVGAGGKAELVHGLFHERLAVVADLAVLPDMARLHVRIGIDTVAFEAFELGCPGAGDAVADRGRRLTQGVRRNLVELDGRDLDMDVDPVHKRTGDF